MKNVVIVGAGPTGLFASSLLLDKGYKVDLYDQKKNAGRKLLLAGKSGLNVTNQLGIESFSAAYGCSQENMRLPLTLFSPTDLRLWLKDLGIETLAGSTGLIFPISSDSRELLSRWMTSLLSYNSFHFHTEHCLINIEKGSLQFGKKDKSLKIKAPLMIMGLGGASYPSTGSDGQWSKLLEKIDIQTVPFKPMNCGFECSWSSFFKKTASHTPLKNIKLTHGNQSARGETMITSYGMEGGPFYHFSRKIRDAIEVSGRTIVLLDLTPDLETDEVLFRLTRNRRKNSLSNYLRKQLNLSPIKISLLRELTENAIFNDFPMMAKKIKNLPLVLERPRPLNEAISSSGGIPFKELDEYFMLKKYPGWFAAGEMIDWDAPTGGYLLQGCFSTAYRAVEGILNYNS